MLRRQVIDGVLAGICIAMGGCVFLSCESRVVGAVLFSIALLTICFFGFSLYTGKIGFLVASHTKNDVSVLLLGLLGNLIGTVIMGYLAAIALPALKDSAFTICSVKLSQTFVQTLIRGFFCGILMYIAVYVYREKKTVTGILFAIPVFILSGFEHSIANMFYFALSGIVSAEAFVYIIVVIIGNSAGGLIIPALQSLSGKE